MKKYLDLIAFILFLILIADVAICVVNPSPLSIISVVLSAIVFILTFLLYLKERKKNK